MKIFRFFSFLALIAAAACGARASHPNVEVVSPQSFSTMLSQADSCAYLLDVRKPDEFAQAHIDGAHLLNWLDTDTFKLRAPDIDKSKTIFIYCRSGRRSNAAASYLASLGYKVVDMDGGILAWQKANLPVVASAD